MFLHECPLNNIVKIVNNTMPIACTIRAKDTCNIQKATQVAFLFLFVEVNDAIVITNLNQA